MILTVTLNVALDVTYSVPCIAIDRVNRVAAVACRAGGKGVNVSRVLAALGRETVVCGLVGGPTGGAVTSDLAGGEMTTALFEIAGETRRTLVAVDEQSGEATGFWEPGPRVSDDEWRRFLDHFDALLTSVRVVVLAGSLPPGVPGDAYAVLSARAARRGVRVLLDADGEALRLGVAGQPDLVKPNHEELTRVTGEEDPLVGARSLLRAGAREVVVSLGRDGLVGVSADGCWSVAPVEHVSGNPTGAGDAAVAALAAGMLDGVASPRRLEDAAALSAAAVAFPLAGGFDAGVYRRHRHAIRCTARDLDAFARKGDALCGDMLESMQKAPKGRK
jgi:tagatose 6-phosphate kinase